MQNRNEKVAVITGASAGVGRATARAFAKTGASIGLIARGREALENAKIEVEQLGGRALVCVADVSEAEALEAAATEIENELGAIDVWVNNAMVSVFSPATEMTSQEFQRVTNVTYLGYVWGTLAALRRMRPRNRGAVIQVGSALAYRGIPLQSAYCACKHAIQGFTESVRCELLHEHSRVRLCMVQMPALNTPQFGWVKSRLPNKAKPVPPIFQPEVAADAIVFAAEHRRREVYVGWPTVKAVVGNKIAPGFADHYLGRTGFKSQQTDEPANPDRPNNLFSPVPGDHGAHGSFDNCAQPNSRQLWVNKNRGWLFAGLAATAIGFGILTRKRFAR